jgi:Subtilase family
MSVLDDILRFFGLLSSDTEETVPVPVVLAKVLDSVTLAGIDKGATLTLDQLVSAAGAPDSPALQAVRGITSNLVFNWAFVSVSMADISALVTRATTLDSSYEAPKFDHFFEVACTGDFDGATLADALDAWSDVIEYAYVVPTASDPVTGTANPFFSGGQQGYLTAAPNGIDAPAAWVKGADGGGILFIDIEQGWFLQHQDLPQTITLLQGTNRKTSFAHGAAVLGEIIGIDDTVGMVGAAPAATPEVVSYNDDLSTKWEWQHVADRVVSAANALPFGDVMLLEVQFENKVAGTLTFVPAESDPLAFEAIALATKAGVIVVEAAGNGKADLDTFVMAKGPRKGKHTLSRSTSAEFADSGAIMVGGATSAYPHQRWSGSNFGSRIDCCAWAENIVSSGWDSSKPKATDRYWGVNLTTTVGGKSQVEFFGGTSGASPIIVGCCLLMQSLRGLLTPKSGTGKLGPFSMRSVLSDPNNGTASFLTTDRIGGMPDFKKIIANEFNP